MSSTFVRDITRYAMNLPRKAPPVAVGHPELGQIGLAIPRRGFLPRGMTGTELAALLRDEARIERQELVRQLQIRKTIEANINSWDGVLNARTNNRYFDFFGKKESQTTVAFAWSSFFRSTGLPGAGTYSNIPTGAVTNRASAGAWPLKNPAAGTKSYLVNVGANHLTGANLVLVADLLVAAGNIDANTASSQTVSSAALTRYTTGEGVMASFEVTTALGATPANLTMTYTNQAGTGSRSTGAIAMTTSAITFRLQPGTGPEISLQGDDFGVRSVQSVQLSAGMGAGVLALNLFKPLVLIPTLGATLYSERSTPGMLGGITELVYGSDSQVGCLTFYVLPNGTSTGQQSYFIQTVEG